MLTVLFILRITVLWELFFSAALVGIYHSLGYVTAFVLTNINWSDGVHIIKNAFLLSLHIITLSQTFYSEGMQIPVIARHPQTSVPGQTVSGFSDISPA